MVTSRGRAIFESRPVAAHLPLPISFHSGSNFACGRLTRIKGINADMQLNIRIYPHRLVLI